MTREVERVRDAILQLDGEFTATDVIRLIGKSSIERQNVRSSLFALSSQHELRVVRPGRPGKTNVEAVYERTAHFRKPPSSIEAQRVAGEFIQNLYREWTRRRRPELYE